MHSQTIRRITIVCVFMFNAVCANSSFAQSKAEFLETKVPKGHDFTKLAADAEYEQGELIIRFARKDGKIRRNSGEKASILSSLSNASVKRNFKVVEDLALVKLSSGKTVEESLKSFNEHPGILYAEPNYKVKLISTFPNDPFISNDTDDPNNLLWGMHNIGQTGGTSDADIDAPEAWDIRTDANEIVVAVIDTGVAYEHPDLADNMWVNEAELNGDPNLDDDENGYVNDIYGYDFCNNDSDPDDDFFHGTHCGGTIGAVSNNGKGVAGVCWNVKIMAVKFLSSGGGGTYADAISSVDYARTMGADIMSASWGGSAYSQGLYDEIEDANDAGILFVAAAGNSSSSAVGYPARYDLGNIISVMSTNHYDNKSSFSNYNSTSVDLAAPGSDILSTFPTYTTYAMAYYGLSTDYETISGTSMATPHVAGACALVWADDPCMTHLEVKEAVLGSVDRLSSLNNFCVTKGRLNLYNALTYKPLGMYIAKTDDFSDSDPNLCGIDPDSSDPNDYKIIYTIDYGNPVTDANESDYIGTVSNVVITDYLPYEVDGSQFFDDDTFSYDPRYDYNKHTYTWDIGTLAPGDSNSVTLTVFITDSAEPLGVVTNEVEIESDGYHNIATEETPVCCFGGDIIYVDVYAAGTNSGTSWTNAYTDLQSALLRADQSCGDEIWVANGIYSPGDSTTDSFTIPDGVEVYGGFAGDETTKDDRDYIANQTYLASMAGNYRIVTIGNDAIFDGFIVKESKRYGIYGTNDNFTVSNCVIADNLWYGIYSTGGNVTVTLCVIKDNGYDGIYHSGSGKTLTVENCMVYGNKRNGINTSYSVATILNSLIYENGSSGSTYYGINLYRPSDNPLIRNNTIVYNTNEGVYFEDTDGDDPDIRNDILWRNDSEDGFIQLANCSATYSCITDPNDPNGVAAGSDVPDNDNNISCDPNFAYDYGKFGYYHLDSGSACVDRGDPCDSCSGEKDFDSASRIDNGTVDMGVDEVDCGNANNEVDFTADGLVNLAEYAIFSAAWLSLSPSISSDPNYTANWDERCDLVADYEIDLEDFTAFCGEWAWQACWWDSDAIWRMADTGNGDMGTILESQLQIIANRPAETTIIIEPPLSFAQQAAQLADSIDFLEEIWEDDEVQNHIDEKTWSDFMDSIYEHLKYLEDQL
jgi:subtilisin family serine protease